MLLKVNKMGVERMWNESKTVEEVSRMTICKWMWKEGAHKVTFLFVYIAWWYLHILINCEENEMKWWRIKAFEIENVVHVQWIVWVLILMVSFLFSTLTGYEMLSFELSTGNCFRSSNGGWIIF